MANGKDAREIKRVRNELLVALRIVYPGALQAEHLMRSVLVLFPTLEFEHMKRDLHYLVQKGYVERVMPRPNGDNDLTPWRKRWFHLTTRGVEVADRCVHDPALED